MSKLEYADLVAVVSNVVREVVESGVKLGTSEDEDMSEESVDDVCEGELGNIGEQLKTGKFLERDMASTALQVMFYLTVGQRMEWLLPVVHAFHKAVLMQVQWKLGFVDEGE